MGAAKFYLSKEKRDELPLKVFGHPKKRLFPILSENDVMSAARLLGRAKLTESEREAVKKRIINIALREGYKLPDTWESERMEASKFSSDYTVSWTNQDNGTSFGVLRSTKSDIATVELCNLVDGKLILTGLTFNCNINKLDLCEYSL